MKNSRLIQCVLVLLFSILSQASADIERIQTPPRVNSKGWVMRAGWFGTSRHEIKCMSKGDSTLYVSISMINHRTLLYGELWNRAHIQGDFDSQGIRSLFLENPSGILLAHSPSIAELQQDLKDSFFINFDLFHLGGDCYYLHDVDAEDMKKLDEQVSFALEDILVEMRDPVAELMMGVFTKDELKDKIVNDKPLAKKILQIVRVNRFYKYRFLTSRENAIRDK